MVELRKRKPRVPVNSDASKDRPKPAVEKKAKVSKKSRAAKPSTSTSKQNKRSNGPSKNTKIPIGSKIPLDETLQLHTESNTPEKTTMKEVLAKANKGLIVFVFGDALSDQTMEFAGEIDHDCLDYEPLDMTIVGISTDTTRNISALRTQSQLSFAFLGDPDKNVLAPLGLGGISPTDKKQHVGAFIVDKSGSLLAVKCGKMQKVLDELGKEVFTLIGDLGSGDDDS